MEINHSQASASIKILTIDLGVGFHVEMKNLGISDPLLLLGVAVVAQVAVVPQPKPAAQVRKWAAALWGRLTAANRRRRRQRP